MDVLSLAICWPTYCWDLNYHGGRNRQTLSPAQTVAIRHSVSGKFCHTKLLYTFYLDCSFLNIIKSGYATTGASG